MKAQIRDMNGGMMSSFDELTALIQEAMISEVGVGVFPTCARSSAWKWRLLREGLVTSGRMKSRVSEWLKPILNLIRVGMAIEERGI